MSKKKKKWKNPGTRTEYDGIYQSWCNMLRRAGNKDGHSPTYSDVTVCDRWLSYDNFFEDMSDTWWKGASIDKDIIKPGNKVYCKKYCKWVSRSENAKERTKRIAFKNPWSVAGAREKVLGSNHYKAKKVRCVETGKIFGTPVDAERELKLKKHSVSRSASPKDKQKTAGGYHWRYIEEE